jgi:hypothetical protein
MPATLQEGVVKHTAGSVLAGGEIAFLTGEVSWDCWPGTSFEEILQIHRWAVEGR